MQNSSTLFLGSDLVSLTPPLRTKTRELPRFDIIFLFFKSVFFGGGGAENFWSIFAFWYSIVRNSMEEFLDQKAKIDLKCSAPKKIQYLSQE